MVLSLKLILILVVLTIYNYICMKKNKYYEVFVCIFFILLFVPIEMQGLITGALYSTPGMVNVSLMGYNVIIAFLCFLIINKGKIKNISKSKFIMILLFVSFLVLIRILKDGMGFLSNKIIDNYISPILLVILLIEKFPRDRILDFFKIIYAFLLINAIIAIIEYFFGKSLFLHEYYLQNIPWYKNVYNSTLYGIKFRCTSFLGHPLINGIYYILAIIYLFNITKMKFNFKQLIQVLIFVLALFFTNSRSELAILLIYMLYKLIKKRKRIWILCLVLLGMLFVTSVDLENLYFKIFARDSSGGSIDVRIKAIQSIFEIPFLEMLFGTGYNNTREILDDIGFSGNLEISYLIILLENGIFGFYIWILLLINLYNKKININNCNFKNLVNELLVVFLIISAAFNSIADPGTLNYTFFSLLALTNVIENKCLVNERKE